MTISLFSSIFFGIVIVCLVCYNGKSLNIQIQDELAERRRKFASA